MTVAADVQTLEPGAEVELFYIDAIAIGAGVLRFHADLQAETIWWQGEEYSAWPVEAKGFALTADKPPQPTLSVANLGGAIGALCQTFEDMVGAKVTRIRTLAKYLDAANFPGGNPDADPDEHYPDEVWYVERKASEDNTVVVFELSSAMDFNGVQLPRRQIIANQCPWAYRSAECSYTGGPVAQADDTPTADPALDTCGKRLASCKLRFGANNELPFGGFPAAGLIRT